MSIPNTKDDRLPSITVLPINSAAESKGSIHDPVKAKEMGYKGGLVPGVTVLGYMSRLMQESFGPAWQRDSTFVGRLRRPVYEGAPVEVEGLVVDAPTDANGNRVTVELKVVGPDGAVAAFAQASCRV